MALPTSKQTGEYEVIESGNYQVDLKRVALTIEKEYQSDNFNNGLGLRYQAIEFTWDVDGQDWTEKFIKVSLHENSKLYNRLSALLGRKIADADKVHWGVSSHAETNHELDNYYRAREDDADESITQGELVHIDNNSEGIIGALDNLSINGEELIGRTCLLDIGVSKSGYNRASAGAANALPKKGKKAEAPTIPASATPEGMPR